jgi:hypothetical protein
MLGVDDPAGRDGASPGHFGSSARGVVPTAALMGRA